jgi:LmbE family N-acetylglucosaminyl deacetylase
MKKLLFGVFAHPDDEAFGPAGTLLLESQMGTEIHLITFTNGSAGANPDSTPDLGSLRLEEWRTAGKLMNVSGIHHLGFADGELNNIVMQEASKQIEQIIRNELKDHAEPVAIELMSFDSTGITGHIDHIVASRTAHHVFYKLKRDGLPLTRLRLYCLPRSAVPEPNIDWIYANPGRTPEEIDETIKITPILDEVREIVRTHHSQRADGAERLAGLDAGMAADHFIIKT